MNLRNAIPRLRLPAVAGLVVALGIAPITRAFIFELGDAKGSFDTTISVGGLYRLNNPDPALYGIANGGLQRSVNADDGDLNYRAGMASFLVKANHDLLIKYQQTGLFVRGFYFNDFVNSAGQRARTPLNDEAQKVVGSGAELLDAYVYTNETIGGMPTTFRLGRQVLSWGESTFIPNGVNSINPIDVAKLRTPGSELKEALRPLMMASAPMRRMAVTVFSRCCATRVSTVGTPVMSMIAISAPVSTIRCSSDSMTTCVRCESRVPIIGRASTPSQRLTTGVESSSNSSCWRAMTSSRPFW